jgi:multicomponent Na+:H+ antiporter subunit D
MESYLWRKKIMQYIPLLFVIIPVIASLVIYLFKYRMISRLVFVFQFLMIAMFIYLLYEGAFEKPISLVFGGWSPVFAISFYLDQTSLIFVGLTLFMWLVILLFTFKKHRDDHMYLFFLMFLQGIFLGLLQTNDLFNFFVFLELITVIVTILISYNKNGSSYRAGIYYLLINTLGAMFFLIGTIILYYVYGTINIQYIASQISEFSNSNIVKLAYVMMLSGISIKAALVPLYSWLPRAHSVAQTSISALLSGLIVKLSLYGFIRIHHDMFSQASYDTSSFFFYIGAVTGLVGVVLALIQKDLKQILAYHTVSQIGLMMMGLSSLNDVSFSGGFLHIINHAFFKSLLFLAAGQVIYKYKTKKVYEIQGVFKTMPFTAVLLIVGMLSISGMPFFSGYVSKSLIKYAFKENVLHMTLFNLINLGTVTSFLKFSRILFGKKIDSKELVKDKKRYISMSLLAISSVIVGILYLPLIINLFGFEAYYINLFDFSSWLNYLLYIFIGFLFYRYVIRKDFKFLQAIRNFSMSFEDANYALILYISIFVSVMFFLI